jgi:CheY-like chemotaxis protein
MAHLNPPHSNFADVLSIGEAADFLGVSTATLRNWDRSGKLKPRRHPQNGYRIYLHKDLEAVLRTADLSTLTEESIAPQINWDNVRDSEHFVQFYENDEFLVASAADFIVSALRDNGSSIIAVTPEHRIAIEQKLIASSIDVGEAESTGRYVALDARETLSRFMVGGSVDMQRFDEFVGCAIGRLTKSGQRLHAFGEMVALLWADENREAAIELERAWNTLVSKHRFALLCAYPIAGFNGNDQGNTIQDVCSCHSRVIPAESYSAADTVDKRMRAIALLQQKAQSLESEIQHRFELETSISKRERKLVDFVESAIEDQKVRAEEVTNERQTSNSKPRILVVDDNHDSCYTLSLLLKLKGNEVRTAADGLEAIAAAEEFRPDIVLMDVGMPKLNGYDATRRLREKPYGKDIMIVALTGWGQASDVARSIEAGCTAHLVKPVDFAELERLLATAKK